MDMLLTTVTMQSNADQEIYVVKRLQVIGEKVHIHMNQHVFWKRPQICVSNILI